MFGCGMLGGSGIGGLVLGVGLGGLFGVGVGCVGLGV